MGRVIIEDTRQQAHKHDAKHQWWDEHGVEWRERAEALPFGDYMAEGSNVCVDTKRSLAELAQNLGRDHRRFAAECDRAREAGYRLVVLVDAPGFATAEDVAGWTNDHCAHCKYLRMGRCDPHSSGRCMRHRTVKPMQGERLASTMRKTEEHHGVRFALCEPADAARAICELLGVEYDERVS